MRTALRHADTDSAVGWIMGDRMTHEAHRIDVLLAILAIVWLVVLS